MALTKKTQQEKNSLDQEDDDDDAEKDDDEEEDEDISVQVPPSPPSQPLPRISLAPPPAPAVVAPQKRGGRPKGPTPATIEKKRLADEKRIAKAAAKILKERKKKESTEAKYRDG